MSTVHIRYVSFLIFCLCVIFSSWGCSLLTINLTERQYLRTTSSKTTLATLADTNLIDFLSTYDRFYAQYDNYLQLTFDEPVDYFSPQTRSILMEIMSWFQYEQRYAEKVVSWLKDFAEFEHNSIYLVNRDTFVPVVDLIFLRDDRYKKYAGDISLGKYNEQIIGSKMYIELNKIGMGHLLDILRYLNNQAKANNLPLVVKTPATFLPDHDLAIQMSTIMVVFVFSALTTGLSFLFFGQPLTSTLCFLVLISTSAATLGLGALWNVPLNAMNISVLQAGLGFTGLLCLTFCYAYHNAQNGRSTDRVVYAFQSLSDGCLWSCLFFALSPLPLLFLIDCEFITQICKLFFLHSIITMVHIFLFLPPCLIVCTTKLCQGCAALYNVCQETCCCCDADEDAESIYYLPTSGQAVDPQYVEQFFRLKFREDIHNGTTKPLPAPPDRRMIMAPPAGDRKSNMEIVRQLSNRQAPPAITHHPDGVAEIRPPRKIRKPASNNNKNKKVRPPNQKPNNNFFEHLNVPEHRQRAPHIVVPPPDLLRQSSRVESICSYTSDGNDNGDHESPPPQQIVEHVETDEEIVDPSKNAKPKICYAKWTKEIPVDAYTTERVIAEKYTIEGDGSKFELPPDWKRFWIKGNLKSSLQQQQPDARGQYGDSPYQHAPSSHVPFRGQHSSNMHPSAYPYNNHASSSSVPFHGPVPPPEFGRPPHRRVFDNEPAYYPDHASPPVYHYDQGRKPRGYSRSGRAAGHY